MVDPKIWIYYWMAGHIHQSISLWLVYIHFYKRTFLKTDPYQPSKAHLQLNCLWKQKKKHTLLSSACTGHAFSEGLNIQHGLPNISWRKTKSPEVLKYVTPPYTNEKNGAVFCTTVPSFTISRSNSNWYQAVWTWRAFWCGKSSSTSIYTTYWHPEWLPGTRPTTAVSWMLAYSSSVSVGRDSLLKHQSGQSPLTSTLCVEHHRAWKKLSLLKQHSHYSR